MGGAECLVPPREGQGESEEAPLRREGQNAVENHSQLQLSRCSRGALGTYSVLAAGVCQPHPGTLKFVTAALCGMGVIFTFLQVRKWKLREVKVHLSCRKDSPGLCLGSGLGSSVGWPGPVALKGTLVGAGWGGVFRVIFFWSSFILATSEKCS